MTKRTSALLLLILILTVTSTIYISSLSHAQTTPISISGKFYKFNLVARIGENDINQIVPELSINDFGTVAFAGKTVQNTNAVYQIFSRKVGGDLTAVTASTLSDGTDWRVFGSLQINNSDQILSEYERRKVGGGFAQEVRRWNGSALESGVLVADGDTQASSGSAFWRILKGSSINNNNQSVIFAAEHTTANSVLAIGTKPNFYTTLANDFHSTAKPMIGDNGNVAVKGDSLNGPLRLYSSNFVSNQDIATVSGTTFSALGHRPGISDDGTAVAFQGTAAVAVPLAIPTAGQGIFLNIPDGSGRISLKVAGNRIERTEVNGLCDAGEDCVGELGDTLSNGPIYLTGFRLDSRIGVIHQEKGAPGIFGRYVRHCFYRNSEFCRRVSSRRLFRAGRDLDSES